MVYTVTFNPSLDYIVEVKDLKMGATNRTSFEQMLPGGKGINVSFVLKNLGIDNTALGFLAGFVGDEIHRRVEQEGITAEFLKLESGISRINVKLRNVDGMEINGMGPEISSQRIEELMTRIDKMQKGDVLVLAGSIPNSMPDSIYMDIMKRIEQKEIKVVVDATKDLLMNVLEYRPFLIKPNHHELGEIFDVTIETRDEVIPYAKQLQKKGACNVLVSMAGEGAVLIDEVGRVHVCEAPQGKVINAVGAGDSMVAGFMAGWLLSGDYEEAFRMGLAAGSASAFSEKLATKEEVEAVYQATWKGHISYQQN